MDVNSLSLLTALPSGQRQRLRRIWLGPCPLWGSVQGAGKAGEETPGDREQEEVGAPGWGEDTGCMLATPQGQKALLRTPWAS